MNSSDSGVGHRAIEGVGTYVPRSRVDIATIDEAWDGINVRGVETKRVPAGDEDAVTMAVAAASTALDDAEAESTAVESLALGTTTPPVDEGEVGATVAEILGLDRTVELATHTQSTRAGVRALVDGVRASGQTLVIAADCPQGMPADDREHAAGAGAVALVVGEADDETTGNSDRTAPTIIDHAAHTEEFAGTRFRKRGSDTVDGYGATTYEREAYTTTVASAVAALDADPVAIAPSAPNGSLPGRAGRSVSDVEVHHMARQLGDTGAASPLFGLVSAWAAGDDSVAVVGYGDGASADAVAIEGALPVETDWPAESLTFAEYARKRGHLGGGA